MSRWIELTGSRPSGLRSSSRLDYARLTLADVDTCHALCRDPYLEGVFVRGKNLPHRWVAGVVAASDQLFHTLRVGVWTMSHTGSPVGCCGFRILDELGPEPQLFFAVAADQTEHGYATESVRAMLGLTRQLGWTRVAAAADRRNDRFIRVLASTGFTECGYVPGPSGETRLFEQFPVPPPLRIAAASGTRWSLPIARTWDGDPAATDEVIRMDIEMDRGILTVLVDAPFHNDPIPGSADLWNYEVVELMLVGENEHYLEVELSPHGQHLVLFLEGVRTVVHRDVRLDYRARIEGNRWRGVAHLPLGWLPAGIHRLNGFAMHGTGTARRYLAWRPTYGAEPDFHRLQAFGSLDEAASTRS